MAKLSVVLATKNEENNLPKCLGSVKDIADEIIVVDEYSTDRTVEIAKSFGAKVYLELHHEIFHITKQLALNKATGDWILQLDADEIITKELSQEIKTVVDGGHPVVSDEGKRKLFERHQKLIEKRDGPIGKRTGEVVAYFIPRRNLFLGKPLIHAGVYPDPAIRLVKKGKAHFTGKSVHDIMQVDGEVSWLSSDMIHNDSPTLRRYFDRLNRYTDLHAEELKQKKVPKNLFYLVFVYSFLKPMYIFLNLFIRHKGFLDGLAGFLWSSLSAMHYPITYFKYWIGPEKQI